MDENDAEIFSDKTLVVKVNSWESKKRTVEEELQPVLVRVPSAYSSCGPETIFITKDQFKIGRRSDNDAVILNVLISRLHCVLRYDEYTDNWLVTNLSSTDTLLNDEPIEQNKTEIIREGDSLQLSLLESFKYRFLLIKKDPKIIKQPKIQSNDYQLNNVFCKERLFVESQENQRIYLEKQLFDHQEAQELLIERLNKLLEDQNITKTCNEKLNNEIIELQKKIELGKSVELEIQQKYRDLLKELEDERLKYEQKLSEEKEKWQKVLQETNQEKEKLKTSMEEQMQKWKQELENEKQKEWQEKIISIIQEEKNIQIKLQDEKQLLEQKLIEIEKALTEKEAEQKDHSTQSLDEKSCTLKRNNVIDVEEDSKPPVIDLTNENSCYESQPKDEILNTVNNIMDEQLTCNICSELFINAVTLDCMHTYCRYCIDSWNRRRKDCPTCRAPIKTMIRSLVMDNFIEKMLESLTPQQMKKRKKLIEQRKISSAMNSRLRKRKV